MTTEALIRDLAAELQPVRPLGRPLVRFGRWAAVAAAWVAGGVAVIGVRADVVAVVRDPRFILHVAVPLVLAAVATVVAFLTSVPDRRSRWSALVPAAVTAAWLLVVVLGVFLAGQGHAGTGLKCLRNLLLLSLPPGLLLYFMLRKAAPLGGGAIGLLAALGVAALAHAGTRFVCHNDGALHILVWHLGFVLLLTALGAVVGRARLR
jgi:hypothetical protein